MPQSMRSHTAYSTKQYVHYLQQQMIRATNSGDRPSFQEDIGSISTQATVVQAPVQQRLICQEVLCSRRMGEW